jgi:hypothetical protein
MKLKNTKDAPLKMPPNPLGANGVRFLGLAFVNPAMRMMAMTTS